ncbi:beta-lactamase domain-containing protein 2-like [Apostichopus japonicus]|uniref:beta-lactamase domain-containing protein 2-like n=1 Tax=Stichopus japonicus TaxID=307972 RepID=UPI003AB62C0D
MSVLRQALLIAVTAVVVGFIVPAFFKPSYPVPEILGTVAPGFEEVREVFRQNYENGWDNPEAGSAFSVYQEGRKVVDLWAGYADQEAKRLWSEDTMSIIFSTTKGLGALCVAMLVDRGHLDFKKPVANYWPEFAQKGKDKITVEQLMEHEAGLAVLNEPMTFDLMNNKSAMDKVLAETEPAWEPGTAHGYHTLSIGPYVDALVRRADPKKRSIGKFFHEEVSKPFGIEAYIGVPLEQFHRVGRLVLVSASPSMTLYALRQSDFARKSILAPITGSLKLLTDTLTNCGEVCEFERLMDPDVLQNFELSSAAGIATASGIAKLFGILANGGKVDNKTLLSQGLIDEYANDRRGPTPDIVITDLMIRWKYGMDVIPQPNHKDNLFGSPGAGGQVGYADPNNKLGYGFISRYMSPMGMQFHDPRIIYLQESVLRAIEKQKR